MFVGGQLVTTFTSASLGFTDPLCRQKEVAKEMTIYPQTAPAMYKEPFERGALLTCRYEILLLPQMKFR